MTCNNCSREARPGFKTCEPCADSHRKAQSRYEARQRGKLGVAMREFCVACAAVGSHRSGCELDIASEGNHAAL